LCVWRGGESVWWKTVKNIREGVGLVDRVPLKARFGRLFEIAHNKLPIVAYMFVLGWGVNGKVWKWRRRLFGNGS